MNNRICLITGAGRGIGRNIARSFCREGYALALTDIDQNLLEHTKRELLSERAEVEVFSADLSISGASQELIERVVKKFGKLDVLINNARAGKRVSFQNESEENWDLTLNVNLKAIFFLVQAAISCMPKESAIVNIGSISGQLVSQESPSYQISKAGLLHLTRYLAVNCGSIRVNSVLPGFIVQDEYRDRYDSEDIGQKKYRSIVESLHPMGGGPGYSDDIADAVIFLASKEAKFITGQSLVVDGGLTVQDPTKILFSKYFDNHGA